MSPIVPPSLLPPAAQGVVFDCDGTLVDSMELHLTAWDATCKEFGLVITRQLMGDNAGVPIDRLFELVLEHNGTNPAEIDREMFFARKKEVYQEVHKPAKLIEPVMEILSAAHAKGLPMAIVSGGTSWHVHQSLEETGIKHYFKAIVTAEDVSKGKPNPEGFLLAAKKIGVPPGVCVGYEDAQLGMQAIKSAGFMLAVDVTLLPGYPRFH